MTRPVGVSPGTIRRRSRERLPVAIPASIRLRISSQDFWTLCAANPDLRLERSAKGVLIVMAPAGSDSGMRNASLSGQLFAWSRADGSGVCFDSSAGFTLSNGAVCAPDASWIVRSRWDELTPSQKQKFAPICPDFVAELQSKSDSHRDVQEKMLGYLDQGARLGWLIDPISATVEIYRSGRSVETLKMPKTLSGEAVLPGFTLDLAGILFD